MVRGKKCAWRSLAWATARQRWSKGYTPINTIKFTDIPRIGVPVSRGMTHDGWGKWFSQVIEKAPGSTVDIVRILKGTGTDVVVSFLPVGGEMATNCPIQR